MTSQELTTALPIDRERRLLNRIHAAQPDGYALCGSVIPERWEWEMTQPETLRVAKYCPDCVALID